MSDDQQADFPAMAAILGGVRVLLLGRPNMQTLRYSLACFALSALGVSSTWGQFNNNNYYQQQQQQYQQQQQRQQYEAQQRAYQDQQRQQEQRRMYDQIQQQQRQQDQYRNQQRENYERERQRHFFFEQQERQRNQWKQEQDRFQESQRQNQLQQQQYADNSRRQWEQQEAARRQAEENNRRWEEDRRRNAAFASGPSYSYSTPADSAPEGAAPAATELADERPRIAERFDAATDSRAAARDRSRTPTAVTFERRHFALNGPTTEDRFDQAIARRQAR